MAEPADPKGEQTICICGHPEHPDHDTEEPARICRTCQREDRHPAGCWGLFPQGSVAVEVDEHGQPVADDLHQAIQAAADALKPEGWVEGPVYRREVARIAVEVAAPVLLQATRDRLADLEGDKATIGDELDKAHAKITDHRQRIESLCDRNTDLEVQVAELHDLLEQAGEYVLRVPAENANVLWDQIQAALQVDGPTRGHAILHEVERLRTFVEEVTQALQPGRWRGFDGPGGVSKDEVIGDVAAAVQHLDQAAQREDGR